MKPIIEVDGLTKIFKLGSTHGSYLTLRDTIKQWFKTAHNEKNFIKAIDNVSFNVKPGEKVGIIGKNGAGKSTLLKILSRITPPSQGKAILRGKVASLLEVGTGFHGELTGRENIFLNGAILGMKRNEIKQKLDEIVDFSGVAKFLDTPLKHYSSGMQLRLAFAVAAHLDTDILLIDEVLAVGDAEFQKKSLGKMEEVSQQQGKTILFVSHNIGAIDSLCSRAILLQNGKIMDDGLTQQVINKYFSLSKFETSLVFSDKENKQAYFSSLGLSNIDNEQKDEFFFNETIVVNISVQLNNLIKNHILAVVLANNYNSRISVFFKDISHFSVGENNIQLVLPSSIIAPGNYFFHFFLYRPDDRIIDKLENMCPFQVFDNGVINSHLYGGNYGFFVANAEWKMN